MSCTILHLYMRIFLVGFMGCGKSHWGQVWAAKEEMQFFDLDSKIEQRQQESVAEIFERHGEDVFRFLETRILRDLARFDNCVIACGGGTPCFHGNMEWMNEKGTTVFIEASPEIIFNNLRNEKIKRPLVSKFNDAELQFYIRYKLEKRRPFYERAKYHLDAAFLQENSLHKIIQQCTGVS